MTYLTRGPVGTTEIGSKGHASREPTPFFAQIVDATGGDGMSQITVTACRRGLMQSVTKPRHAHSKTSGLRFKNTPQATP